MLPDEYKDFKLAKPVKGSRNYFHEHAIESWSFRNYFKKTHNDFLNKFKKYSTILMDYNDDLKWIIDQKSTPEKVKDYLISLKNQKAPDMKILKGEAALPKTSKSFNNKNTINISGDNHGNINLSINVDQPESSGMALKRKYGEDLDNSREREIKKLNKSNTEDDPEIKDTIWSEWVKFLDNKDNIGDFHPYSPEYHRVIRCGKTVSPRPSLKQDLYHKHLDQHKDSEYALPVVCIPYINQVMGQETLKGYRKAIQQVPEVEEQYDNTFFFLEDVFKAVYAIHTTFQDIHDGETVFNSLFLFPFLRAVSAAVAAEVEGSKTDFSEGEVCLKAMSVQLKAMNLMVDERTHYKADGLIRMYGYKQLEVLILETSSFFGSTDQVKSKFDHHKGLFGTLAMLKTIADNYQYGSLETFKKIRICFVHATDKTVYFWSMSLAPEGSIYELWLEDSLVIKPDYNDKVEAVPNIIQFFWKMKEVLKITSSEIMNLKKEHDAKLTECRFMPSSSLTSLSDAVNPSILRLTEEEDKSGMGELGPYFSPKN